MTGRENQFALYVRDRWNVTQKLTLSLGVRMEYYPLMTRADSGIERLDLNTWTLLMGGRGDVPEDVGIDLKKLYFAPRLGAMYRLTEKSVIRAGYGRTINPLPWSRPMRGAYPYDVFLNADGRDVRLGHHPRPGHPGLHDARPQHGPRSRCRWASSPAPRSRTTSTAARIQQWNVAFEQRLPWDLSAEIAYVGTATDGGYADLNINYGEPGGGNAARKYFAHRRHHHGQLLGLPHEEPVQGPAARPQPPVPQRPDAEGRLHALRGEGHDDDGEDGWVGLTWNHPLKYDDNFALAVFDRTHVAQLGFLYELPFLKESKAAIGKGSSAAGR